MINNVAMTDSDEEDQSEFSKLYERRTVENRVKDEDSEPEFEALTDNPR